MSYVQQIKANFADAVVPRCRERGCELKRSGLTAYVVLKGEKLRNDRRMPDCIIFVERPLPIVGVAELKSKTIHASEIREKLTNGSRAASEILEKRGFIDIPARYYHLVLAKSWPGQEVRAIRRRKLKVRGVLYDIILGRCGTSLSKAIAVVK